MYSWNIALQVLFLNHVDNHINQNPRPLVKKDMRTKEETSAMKLSLKNKSIGPHER